MLSAMQRSAQVTPAWAEHLVRLMDDGFRVPGTQLRVGLDAVLGLLLPGIGDAAGALSSMALFGLALRRKVPRAVLLRMALNTGVDALVGAIPLLGDWFDLTWKANRRNLILIEQATRIPATSRRLGDWLLVAAILMLVMAAVCLPIVAAALLLRACLSS